MEQMESMAQTLYLAQLHPQAEVVVALTQIMDQMADLVVADLELVQVAHQAQ
jgi:hypothetical protein